MASMASMKKDAIQTAPASQEKLLSEIQTQPQLPREFQPRLESSNELKTFWDEKELLRL